MPSQKRLDSLTIYTRGTTAYLYTNILNGSRWGQDIGRSNRDVTTSLSRRTRSSVSKSVSTTSPVTSIPITPYNINFFQFFRVFYKIVLAHFEVGVERVSFEKFIFTRENEDDFYRGLRGGEFDNCLLITKDPNCVGKHILFYICQKIGFYIQKVFFHLGFKRCEIDEELCHSAILLRAGSRYSFTVPGKEARFGYKQLEAHALARGVVINQENSLRPPTKDASEVVIFRPVDRAFREAVGLTARATAVDERRPGNAGFKRLRFSLKTLCQSIFSPQIKDQLQEKDALHALMGAVDVLLGRAFRDKDNNPIHGLCSTYTYRVIQAARVISKLTLNEREEIAYETIRGAELNVQDTRLWDTLLRPEGFAKLNADARARLSHYLRELVPSFVPEESREGVAGGGGIGRGAGGGRGEI